MPINQDTKKFQESITQELNTIKDMGSICN